LLFPNQPLVLLAPISAAAGSLAVLAFAPFGWFPLAVLSLALAYGLLAGQSPRRAFWIGWAYGVGLMGFGVLWIRISLNEFGNMAAWLAHLLTFLFVLGMGLYYGLAGWLIGRLSGRSALAGALFVFPGIWVLTEWLRGWLFTGFPWLAVGYSQIDSPLAGVAPVVGVHGLSLAVALSGGLLWLAVMRSGGARAGALAGLALLWLGGLGLGRIEWTQPAGEPLRATVVQANVQQSLKWDPESRIPTLRAYVELTRASFGSDLIVWPETAVPDFLHQVRNAFITPLTEEAREAGAELVIGIPVLNLETGDYYNGLIAIGSGEDLYFKRHLVPFGEFMPFKAWLAPLAEAFEVPMSDFSAGTAERPLLRVGPHLAGASICYEDAFPAEVRQALPDAAYLINVSNDAWFGDSLAPHQHLEIARMRSRESERALVRATNTGISAIMDHSGQLLGTVPAFERGVFTAEIQPRTGATPFAAAGNGPAVLLALGLVAIGAGLARRMPPA
jgi:apolipoprotein N-acyltransferase